MNKTTLHQTADQTIKGRTIGYWDPEDVPFWEKQGRSIANRNLWTSIFALFLGFIVWQFMSVVAVKLNGQYSDNQLFWLAALPALSGSTLRIFYSFLVPVIGGRRWTVISTALLLIPAVGLSYALANPGISFMTMMLLALSCGFGGGVFSSSMANISFFYPAKEKGTALGLNAGLGNLGVSAVQLISPMVIGLGLFTFVGIQSQTVTNKAGEVTEQWLQNATLIWVPLIVLACILAWFFMNDLSTAKASFKQQSVIFKRKHNWLMCFLYLGAFGSFIGFSAGFPLLITKQFPAVNALAYAWLGPFVGAIIRPFGGWLSDKLGGARVTLWCFVVMLIAVLAILCFLPKTDSVFSLAITSQFGNFWGFFLIFMLLFFCAGLCNGSTYRMIPIIFMQENLKRLTDNSPTAREIALKNANTESAAVLGFAGAFAAYGGFFIPKSFGTSLALTGGAELAFLTFAVLYLLCIGVTWFYYSRRNAATPC